MARNAVPPPCAKLSIATTTFDTIGRSWRLCQTRTSGANCRRSRMQIPYKCPLANVMERLVMQEVDHKTAALMLYALQTASMNLKRTSLEPELPTQVVIRSEEHTSELQ